MTSREREILEILKKEPMIAQQALADRLKLNRSSVAVHIANLMKKGYIMGKGYIVSEEKKVTVIGGSNIDLQGFPNESLKLYDSNPGKIETSLGGVGRNISENLAKLDIPVRLISAVGNDFYGQKLIKESEKMGIDMKSSLISDSYPTSMYLSIMDEQNDMRVAISQMDIYELIDETFIQENQLLLKNANIIVLDTNIPKKTIDYIGMNFSDIPIFVDPVSSKKAMRLKDSLKYIHTIKPNRHEVSDLLGIPADTIDDIRKAGEKFLEKGLKQVFISMGSEGVFACDEKTEVFLKAKAKDIKSATGAGDAFMAGIISSYLKGSQLDKACTYATGASLTALKSYSTINPAMSESEIEKTLTDIEFEIKLY